MANSKKLSRYPGARPFEQKQSSLFFGRENDINALYRLITGWPGAAMAADDMFASNRQHAAKALQCNPRKRKKQVAQ